MTHNVADQPQSAQLRNNPRLARSQAKNTVGGRRRRDLRPLLIVPATNFDFRRMPLEYKFWNEGFGESNGGVPEGHARLEEGAIGEAEGDGVADQDAEGGRSIGVFDLVVALVGRADAALDLRGRHGAADGLLAYHHFLLRRPVQRVRKPLRAQKKNHKTLKIQPIPSQFINSNKSPASIRPGSS